jgi:hypothetical protein
MVSDSKQPVVVPVDLLCFCCKGQLTVEKDIGNCIQNTQPNSTFQEIENLREDMLELNKILNVVKRYLVKDTILAEINLISAKIDSLHVPQLQIQIRSHYGQR